MISNKSIAAMPTADGESYTNYLIMPISVKDTLALGVRHAAFADGTSHPCGTVYSGLSDAQADYPFAQSANDEIDALALQLVLNKARHLSLVSNGDIGLDVVMPAGDYLINRTINWSNIHTGRLYGEGDATSLFWTGPTTADPNNVVLLLASCNQCVLERFRIMNRVGGQIFAAFRLVHSGATTWIPSSNIFRNITVGGFYGGQFTYGYSIDAGGAGGDQNNEDHSWEYCNTSGYTQAAWRVHASQAHNLSFYECQMGGNNTAPYGVLCEYGGYFRWYGGSGGQHSGADFYAQDFVILVDVDGWDSEGSSRLCSVWSGANDNSSPVTIRNCRFAGTLVPDNQVVRVLTQGTVTIQGNTLSASNGNPRIWVGGFGDSPTVVVHQCNQYQGTTEYSSSAMLVGDNTGILDHPNTYNHPTGGAANTTLTAEPRPKQLITTELTRDAKVLLRHPLANDGIKLWPAESQIETPISKPNVQQWNSAPSLVDGWKLDQLVNGLALSKNRLLANDLSQVNGPISQGQGLLAATAMHFVASKQQSLVIPVAGNMQLLVDNCSFTITGWVNFSVLTSGVYYALFGITRNDGTNYQPVQIFKHAADTRVFLYVHDLQLGAITVAAPVVVQTNQWYFWAAWYDATAKQIGMRIGNQSNTSSFTGTIPILGDPRDFLTIGSLQGQMFLDGLIQDVDLHKTALTQTQLDWKWNNGLGQSITLP
jgi:hypothetical protein